MMAATDASPRSRAQRASGPHLLPMRLVLPLLAATLLVGAVGEFVYRYLSDSIRNETDRTLAVIAEQKRQQIEALLAERPDRGRVVLFRQRAGVDAVRPVAGRADGRTVHCLARMQDRIGEVARLRGWGGIAVVDAEARPVFVNGEVVPQEHADLLRDILDHPRIELVDLHRNAQGEAEYGVLAPIGLRGAAPLGAVYLVWRADRSLYPLVKSWPVPTRTAETYLVRRDGDRVRFLTPLRHLPDAELTLTRPLSSPDLPAARAALGERGILAGGRDYRGVSVLAYTAAVAGTPWSMVAEIDESEAYAGIRTTAWTIALVMGLILLVLYSAGYLLWRRELASLRARQASEARFPVYLRAGTAWRRPGRLAQRSDRRGQPAICRHPRPHTRGAGDARLDARDPPGRPSQGPRPQVQLNAGEISDFRSTKRYLRPDGSVVWVNLTVAQLKVETEGNPRNLAIVEDITERQRMEEKLRISEEKFRSLVETSSDCIWEIDAEGRYTYLSPKLLDMTGYPPAEFLGKTPFDLLPEYVAQQVRERMSTSLSARKPFSSLQQPVRHRDGRLVVAEINGIPLYRPRRRVSGHAGCRAGHHRA